MYKCFSDSNTKQRNYYANPTLPNKQPNTVIAYVGPNDIKKLNHSKIDVADLVHRIINIGEKCKSNGVKNIAILSILVSKNHNVSSVKWGLLAQKGSGFSKFLTT